MHAFRKIPIWKEAPFIRLIIPFVAGILLQWYFPASKTSSTVFFCCLLLLLIVLLFIPIHVRFRYSLLPGFLLNALLLVSGMLLTNHHYTPNKNGWIGHHYNDSAVVIATIEEPLAEKENSYKAVASVTSILLNNKNIPVSGRIILYFRKDSVPPALIYGNLVIFNRPLQLIKPTGNPGAFNYQKYASFQGIYHQAFLKPGEWVVLKKKQVNRFKQFLFTSRERIISILRINIKGNKETGLAEAMLIGYKDDLDKNLVQAYSNTGVVHVIAISGLHLGLIYWLLTLFFRPFSGTKKLKWIKPVVIVASLWLFSLLTGGSASVLRSAVMFSCIVAGESLSKKTSVYNTLAASAFLLLCYNPFWLWDAGFQLSYIAVLSIILFSKPIYNMLYISNKVIDPIWKLSAVTIAAQILTTPISVYYFHQFPLLFMITNLVAVPVSSIILLGELFLCAVSLVPILATAIGWLLHSLIAALNYFIEQIDTLSFSVLSNLYINIPQVLLLYATITALACWLFQKNNKAIITALFCLLSFVSLRTISFIHSATQRKIIVYNVPQQQAIDFINGRYYFFKGDSNLLKNEHLQNFHLTPSRILHRCQASGTIAGLFNHRNLFIFGNIRILVIDNDFNFTPATRKIKADIVILSHNPRLYIKDMLTAIECRQIVIDSSNPIWKINLWRNDCDSAGVAYHIVGIKGAFVMNLP